jgi:hypothetical protein
MSGMGSHDPFGHLKRKLWLKKEPGVKLPLKVGNRPVWVGGVWHTIGKLSTKATTFL